MTIAPQLAVDSALISVADHCAVACRFCFRADKGKDALTRPRLARVLSRLRELGVRQVCFTGGEPTDHPDFIEFCKIALQFGVHPSVVSSARSNAQVEQLKEASKFLVHVTLSADSAAVCERFASPRTIATAASTLARLSGPEKSLHVTLDSLRDEDVTVLQVALRGVDVLLELSPLLPATAARADEAYNRTLAQFRADLHRLDRHIALSPALQAIMVDAGAASPARTCAKQRLYVSAGGELRFCPYHKDDPIAPDADRAELATRLAALRARPLAQSSLCWLVCGR